jgi:hypothetical protein
MIDYHNPLKIETMHKTNIKMGNGQPGRRRETPRPALALTLRPLLLMLTPTLPPTRTWPPDSFGPLEVMRRVGFLIRNPFMFHLAF